MSSTSTTASARSFSSSISPPIRPSATVLAALQTKKNQLTRAWAVMFQPNRDGILGGRRRDNRGNVLRLIERFDAQVEELKDELFKARCFELWIDDMTNRLGSWEEDEEN